MDTGEADVRLRLLRLIDAAWIPHAIRAACSLRLPELLGQRRDGIEALAAASATHAPSLRRLLRALASLDLCHENEDGSYHLTAMGSLLREDAPESLRAWALLTGGPLAQRLAELEQSVRTGESFPRSSPAHERFQRDGIRPRRRDAVQSRDDGPHASRSPPRYLAQSISARRVGSWTWAVATASCSQQC